MFASHTRYIEALFEFSHPSGGVSLEVCMAKQFSPWALLGYKTKAVCHLYLQLDSLALVLTHIEIVPIERKLL